MGSPHGPVMGWTMGGLQAWSTRAALGALVVFVVGLSLFGLSFLYDLRNWDAVVAPSRATYTIDDHGAGEAAAWMMSVGVVGMSGLTILALAFLTAPIVRGSRFASGLTCVITCSYLLCCGAWFPGLAGRGGGHDTSGKVFDPTHDQAAPTWVHLADAYAAYLIVGGAALATIALLLPATRREGRGGVQC